MNTLDKAKAHLAKAREYLEAASVSQELGLFNAATSNAVISGINSKDAMCLILTGKTGKTEDHRQASRELATAGPVGKEMSSTLGRLLSLKSKAQYQTTSMASADASRAVEWAERLLTAAQKTML